MVRETNHKVGKLEHNQSRVCGIMHLTLASSFGCEDKDPEISPNKCDVLFLFQFVHNHHPVIIHRDLKVFYNLQLLFDSVIHSVKHHTILPLEKFLIKF